MTDPGPRAPGLGALAVALVLLACAAGGFVLQRFTRPRPTLYAAPAVTHSLARVASTTAPVPVHDRVAASQPSPAKPKPNEATQISHSPM